MYRCVNRCPACPGTRNVVPADGPPNARIMGIGEGPGPVENNTMHPFSGPTGEEMNQQYLRLAGLDRRDIYMTNTVKCWPEEEEGPPPERAKVCSEFHLRRELEMVRPELVLVMGAIAYNTLVTGHPDLELVHGSPLYDTYTGDVSQVDILGWSGSVFPSWHPASGMHDTGRMVPLREGFRRLGAYLDGNLELPTDRIRRPHYVLLQGSEVSDYLDWDARWFASDTESVPTAQGWRPFCLTFSSEFGTGYMVRSEDKEGIGIVSNYARKCKAIWLLHNAPHDLKVYSQMGLTVPRFYDTMSGAYHLGNLPQSLKVLAYRLCGMVMDEFEDTVYPYAKPIIKAYLEEAASRDWPKPRPIWNGGRKEANCRSCGGKGVVGEGRGKARVVDVCPECDGVGRKSYKQYSHPWGVAQYLSRLLGDYAKDPVKVSMLDRWKGWAKDWEKTVTEDIEERMGRFPWPSIAQVPIEKALYYACRDADATLRVHHQLLRLKTMIRRNM